MIHKNCGGAQKSETDKEREMRQASIDAVVSNDDLEDMLGRLYDSGFFNGSQRVLAQVRQEIEEICDDFEIQGFVGYPAGQPNEIATEINNLYFKRINELRKALKEAVE